MVILTETKRLAAAEAMGGPGNAPSLLLDLDVSWMEHDQVGDEAMIAL
jgi:hypothetical protein